MDTLKQKKESEKQMNIQWAQQMKQQQNELKRLQIIMEQELMDHHAKEQVANGIIEIAT